MTLELVGSTMSDMKTTSPTRDEIRVFNDAVRAFKCARGTYRRPHATTIAELGARYPELRTLLDASTEIALRFYNR